MDYSNPPMKPLVILVSSFAYVDEEEKRSVEDMLKLSGLDLRVVDARIDTTNFLTNVSIESYR
jgi:hypothetical protein